MGNSNCCGDKNIEKINEINSEQQTKKKIKKSSKKKINQNS